MDEDSNFQGFGPSQVSGAAEVIPPRSLVDFSVFVYHACLYRVTLGQTAGDGGCRNTSEDERKKNRDITECFLLRRTGWQRQWGACLTLWFKQIWVRLTSTQLLYGSPAEPTSFPAGQGSPKVMVTSWLLFFLYLQTDP